MGGDHLHCFASEDELSSLENDDYSEIPSYPSSVYRNGSIMRGDEDESVSESSGFLYGGFDKMSHGFSSNPVEFDGNVRRRKIAYNEVMRNYDELWTRRECLYQAKSKILSYIPGSWISNTGDKKLSNYVIPKTTTLLLIGPRGSGKSSLVNRISRVFEDDKFASERAQVTYNSSTREGTFFLQEYMMPRRSTSVCLFDTRSLSEDFVENDETLQHWMTKGVRHGELVIRDSDSSSLKKSLKCKAQRSGTPSSEIRKVNFVVFVINGLSVLRSMNNDKKEDSRYMEMVSKTFNSPYLSFKDDKPLIVVTHGDLLSLGDRARVRVYLGEKLGVPPAKQIFDIPDSSDPLTELTILDMIRYSLEHADKHMPCKESREWVNRSSFSMDGIKDKVSGYSTLTLMFMAILLGIACVALPMYRSHKHSDPPSESEITWPSKSKLSYPFEPYEHLVTYPSSIKSKSTVNHSREKREHQNRVPQATSSPTLPSESAVDNQGYESNVPQATSSPTLPSDSAVDNQIYESKVPQPTPAPTLPSQFAVDNQEIGNWEAGHEDRVPQATSAQTLTSEYIVTKSTPVKSVGTSIPTSQLKSVGECRDKRPEARSPSPPKRHPKAAVKWHKIRHLWLDD